MGGRDYNRARGNFRGNEYVITLIVMIFQVYAYDQNCQVVHLKYVQFIEYHLYHHKVIKII